MTTMGNGTALLVIDVQVGMFDGPDGSVYDAQRLLENIGAVIRKARDAGSPVIYIQHCDGSGEPLEPDTRGWEIHPSVAPLDGEAVIRKRTPDSFHETNLRHELDAREIKSLIMVGIQTECCVDTTCRRAFSMGYHVVLVKDAHGTYDTEELSAAQIIAHHNRILGGRFAETVEAEALEIQAMPTTANRR